MTTVKYDAHKALIESVCAVTTDQQTLAIAKWWEMQPNGQAAKHLDYYLSGKAGTVTVDLEQLLRQDSGVREWLQKDIRAKLAAKQLQGTTKIPQLVYRDRDWQYAIGGMNLNWEVRPPTAAPRYKAASVRVYFTNNYRWHPNEDRITQCIHQAAERLKVKGAADFTMKGEAEIPVP